MKCLHAKWRAVVKNLVRAACFGGELHQRIRCSHYPSSRFEKTRNNLAASHDTLPDLGQSILTQVPTMVLSIISEAHIGCAFLVQSRWIPLLILPMVNADGVVVPTTAEALRAMAEQQSIRSFWSCTTLVSFDLALKSSRNCKSARSSQRHCCHASSTFPVSHQSPMVFEGLLQTHKYPLHFLAPQLQGILSALSGSAAASSRFRMIASSSSSSLSM